ncbi:hypothetical protein Sjap_011155 [Stephania japonica]|uniref:Uncharacterized protein n=1 Tax=Stephania japonica TaxID=461633 RepID=A0AAP0JCZ2_9MAGN
MRQHGYLTCEAHMKILFGTTEALTYLHEAIEPKMVHRGFGNTCNQISASFASDGKHIVSASEDSNVYVWNYNNQDGSAPSHAKSTRCREHFFSSNASVAIPWRFPMVVASKLSSGTRALFGGIAQVYCNLARGEASIFKPSGDVTCNINSFSAGAYVITSVDLDVQHQFPSFQIPINDDCNKRRLNFTKSDSVMRRF